MAENDIYNSKRQWLTIINKINSGVYLKPNAKTTYYIKNSSNIRHFKALIKKLEVLDISFIRRIQFVKALRKTCFYTKKDLKDLSREDAEEIIRETNKIHKTTSTRRDFVNYNKFIWKLLFPELDSKGRADDSITPYVWRIKVRQDKSNQKDRGDKLTDAEYIKIQRALSQDPRMQLYFSMMYSNLARPQELCYIDLNDIKVFENYARVRISKHGKEGTKDLQLIDNFGYLVEWLNKHPFWNKDNSKPLFITMGNSSRYERLNPKHSSKILKTILKRLGINKPITNYSFKRNGVTSKVIAGESPQSIQKTAGWTSTSQLKTYDMSSQEDFFEQELIEKGILKAKDKDKKKIVQYRVCGACNEINPTSNEFCSKCNRPLNREQIIKAEQEKEQQIEIMQKQMEKMQKMMELIISSGADASKIRAAIKLKK